MIIPIWAPRWHDKTVLIDRAKVRAYTQIKFTKTKSLPGIWWVPGDVVRKYPLQRNGGIMVHQVPMHELNQWKDDVVPLRGEEI